jgi:hypothetical protein
VTKTAARLIALLIVAAIAMSPLAAEPADAAVALTVTPLTWNVIGLDSNDPASGPNRFPVGARVCVAAGSSTAGAVTATFSWDSSNPYVQLRPGSLATIDLGSIAAGSCADAYFEVEVDRTAAAYDTTRSYHITATDSLSGATAATPQPRELYVEHLISQSRNGITSIKLNGTSIPAGGNMTLVVGNTYTIELAGYTATQGYNQLESFINFPNTIFQTLAVSTTYTSDTSPYVTSPNDKLYADACLWENDPNSPNYRSCVGGDGKAGGTVVTTYTVKIISGAGNQPDPEQPALRFLGQQLSLQRRLRGRLPDGEHRRAVIGHYLQDIHAEGHLAGRYVHPDVHGVEPDDGFVCRSELHRHLPGRFDCGWHAGRRLQRLWPRSLFSRAGGG